jgi:hypothetical protein
LGGGVRAWAAVGASALGSRVAVARVRPCGMFGDNRSEAAKSRLPRAVRQAMGGSCGPGGQNIRDDLRFADALYETPGCVSKSICRARAASPLEQHRVGRRHVEA